MELVSQTTAVCQSPSCMSSNNIGLRSYHHRYHESENLLASSPMMLITHYESKPSHRQAFISHFYVRGCRSTRDANCGPEPCQGGPALTFPVSCPCLRCTGHLMLSAQAVIKIMCSMHSAWRPLPYAIYSLLNEMITPQTYITSP